MGFQDSWWNISGNVQFPQDNLPLRHFPLPCSVWVRVRSVDSKVRVTVGSVGLGSVGLGLRLELGLGLWFGLGGNVREGKSPAGMSDTQHFCVKFGDPSGIGFEDIVHINRHTLVDENALPITAVGVANYLYTVSTVASGLLFDSWCMKYLQEINRKN